MAAGVSASLKVQCAMTSFSCHILLDQSVTIFQNSFLYFCTFYEALLIVVHFILFLVSSHEFTCFVLCVIFCAFVIFFIFIRVFSALLFSVHSTMIQPYFTPQFLDTMFSFVLVCAKCSSLQCFSTFLRVLRSALTQQFSLVATM